MEKNQTLSVFYENEFVGNTNDGVLINFNDENMRNKIIKQKFVALTTQSTGYIDANGVFIADNHSPIYIINNMRC